MHNVLKLLPLLALLVTVCAPPPRSLCFNPDPASGVCRDAELRQAEKDKAREVREQRTQKLAGLEQAVQLANTQLAIKKEEIAAARDHQTATRLSREHDAIAAEIIGYQMEAEFELGTKLGTRPDKIGTHEQPITLHLKHDTETSALLPVLGGLDHAQAVQVSYLAMQHKFITAENDSPAAARAEEMSVSLPATLRIPLQLQFTLAQVMHCGQIVMTAEDNTGGEVETQLAEEDGC